MRYEVLLADLAERTYTGLPPAGKAAFEAKRRRLAVSPEAEGSYFPKLDRWIGDLGPHGVIEYTVHGSVVRVVVWRVQYVG
ncbi:hypothetical protein [Crossiella sp. CA198]|uniref:hypothetical protein n=1 Tax=Crossiella sp. CA198 TaxID=3455607 RepID=UPI003F8D4D11